MILLRVEIGLLLRRRQQFWPVVGEPIKPITFGEIALIHKRPLPNTNLIHKLLIKPFLIDLLPERNRWFHPLRLQLLKVHITEKRMLPYLLRILGIA